MTADDRVSQTVDRTLTVRLLELGDQWSRAVRRQRSPDARWVCQRVTSYAEIRQQTAAEAYSLSLIEPRPEVAAEACRLIRLLTCRP
ncbi:MAG: hypothetical protein GTO62_17655, partial [Planctomycetales bacterium]|nr:hypothetical protein [Planctomycetales bacterium]NIP71056.1 hypothetical protein [Planctomycetales bacterium]